jgi:hypothetical protein
MLLSLEVVLKPQIRFKSKAQDAGGAMCNISKSAVHKSTLADEQYILKRFAIRQRSLAD